MIIVLIAILVTAAARFGFQGWNGYRCGRVKAGWWSGQYVNRQDDGRLFWAAITLHIFVIAIFVGGAVALAIVVASN